MSPLRLACSIWIVVCCAVGDTATADDMVLRVQEALDTVNGDQYARLVALGPEAVPAICDQLVVHVFPEALVQALGDFQDDRAALPLLEFLETHPDLADYTIRALKEIGDLRAEPALLGIARDEAVPVSTRYEATVALARLGSPDVKAWAWKEILRIYKTRENVSHVVPLDGDVILDHDVTKGLCEVLTEEADREIAELLRHGNVNVGPVYKRAETRDRKWVVNAYLHLAEHDGREEDGYEGRHTDYYQNVSALWTLHEMGGVVPTWKMLDIMATLERRYPELAVPQEGEDTSLDQVITRFQRLKETILSEPTAQNYRHPMTRKEELLNYLWCYEFQYDSIREYVTEKDRPLLVDMLRDPTFYKAWWNIPMVLGVLGEDVDAYNGLLAYIQRQDGSFDHMSQIDWRMLSIGRKCDAVQWLPRLDAERGARLLVEIVTSPDTASEFLQDWSFDESANQLGYARTFKGRLQRLRGSAALGLVLIDKEHYLPVVRQAFDHAHEMVWEQEISKYADAQGDETGGRLYALCHQFAIALAVAEYLDQRTPDEFWETYWRERTFEPSKRADEMIQDASDARAATEIP